jgi:hypothetical protein
MKRASKVRGIPRLDHSALSMSTLAAATRITAASIDKPATYEVNLQLDWVIGAAPSGSYVTALLTRAARIHHNTVHHLPTSRTLSQSTSSFYVVAVLALPLSALPSSKFAASFLFCVPSC